MNTTTKGHFKPQIYTGSCYMCPFETQGATPDQVNMALIAHECVPPPLDDPLSERWIESLRKAGVATSDHERDMAAVHTRAA